MYLPQMLGRELLRHRIGYYIRHLYLKLSPRYAGDLADGGRAYMQHYPQYWAAFRKALDNLGSNEGENDSLKPRYFEKGEQTLVLVLLMYCSSNLSTLEFQIDEREPGLDLLDLIKRLARGTIYNFFQN